jgi:hypothetical protein
MTAYTLIADSEKDVDSPITESFFTRFRNNPIAITEGSTGAPKIQTAAYQDASVTQQKIPIGYPAAQTLTDVTGATYTFAHGRAARPWRIDVWLECIAADRGYSIGDFIVAPLQCSAYDNFEHYGLQIAADASSVFLIIGDEGLLILPKSSTTPGLIAASKWAAHLYCWGA